MRENFWAWVWQLWINRIISVYTLRHLAVTIGVTITRTVFFHFLKPWLAVIYFTEIRIDFHIPNIWFIMVWSSHFKYRTACTTCSKYTGNVVRDISLDRTASYSYHTIGGKWTNIVEETTKEIIFGYRLLSDFTAVQNDKKNVIMGVYLNNTLNLGFLNTKIISINIVLLLKYI